MVMEFAENGNLFYYQNQKKTFTEEEASVFFDQTLSAVEYLHSLNYVHRDLKPENLLLDKDLNIKICDLGWIVEGINLPHSTFCGTYEYMAPEMLFEKDYDHRIDIWALGVLLYELLHGFAPFEGDTVEAVRDAMLQGEIHIDPSLSSNVQNLIFNLLKVDPH
jgi:serine/threonine protein kinase